MLIRIGAFRGVAPKVQPRNLPDGVAQIARDAKLWNTSLRPYRAAVAVAPLSKAGVKRSIYRFGRNRPTDAEWWMHWTSDVDVVRSPVATTTNERTYFTGDGVPKVTDATLVTSGGGTQYPNISRPIGVPAPTQRPLAVASGTADASDPIQRFFVLTFVNAWGEEGPPSPVSNDVSATLSQTIDLSGLEVPAGSWTYIAKRIYMTNGTGAAAGFYLVQEIGAAQTSVSIPATVATGEIDGVPIGTGVGESLITQEFYPPPADMVSLGILPGGVLYGISDMRIVFCEPGYPYAWPPGYAISFEHRPIAAKNFDNTIVVATDGVPYLVQGFVPGEMQVRKLEREQACVSKRSMVSAGGGVGYASPDGFILVSPGGVEILTDPFFDRDQWQALNPSSMVAVYWDRRIVVFYDAGAGSRGAFMLEPDKEPVFLSLAADAAYVDPQRDALYVAIGNEVRRFDAGAELALLYRTKVFVAHRPINFSVLQASGKAMAYTLRLYGDGVLRHTTTLTGSQVQRRLPGGFLASEHEIELEGTGEIFLLELAQRMAEFRAA